MPDNIYLPLQVPSAPEGFCSTLGADWVQQLLNLFGQSVAVLNSGSGAGTILLNQESLPGVDQRGFLWRRPSRGNLIFYWAGAWVAQNPIPSGGIERQWVEGTPAEIWLMDGGSGDDPSIVTPTGTVGAMWEIDTNYAGRSPMGVGAIPNSFPAKTLSLSENFGEGAHTQTEAEMFRHTHPPKDGYGSFAGFVDAGQPSSFEITGGTEVEKMTATGETGGNAGSTNDAANVVHPVRGGYMVKRTGRTLYIAT